VPLTASQNQQDTVEQVENENVKQEQVEDESSDSERIDALEVSSPFGRDYGSRLRFFTGTSTGFPNPSAGTPNNNPSSSQR
jgi:hypothetical protein